MPKRSVCRRVGAALALCAAWTASAESFAAEWPTGSFWRWDDPSSARPQSWLPGTSYGYVAAGAGPSDFDLGRCASGFACDASDLGYKLSTGGKFSPWLGMEAAYVYLGKGAANGGNEKAQGLNLNVVANLPLSDLFGIYGKVGGVYGWTRTRAAASSGAIEGNDNGLNWSYGAGIQLDVNRNWAVKVDWDHYRFDYVDRIDDAQLYSLNLVYKF